MTIAEETSAQGGCTNACFGDIQSQCDAYAGRVCYFHELADNDYFVWFDPDLRRVRWPADKEFRCNFEPGSGEFELFSDDTPGITATAGKLQARWRPHAAPCRAREVPHQERAQLRDRRVLRVDERRVAAAYAAAVAMLTVPDAAVAQAASALARAVSVSHLQLLLTTIAEQCGANAV